MKISKVLLIALVLGFVLRIVFLSVNPPSLTPDEASLGYNAYSILKTGKDEYGKVLPVIFKSFGDYKPGLYVYLTVPFVFMFGLNEISVRFASVVAGVVAIWLIYLIMGKLFPDKKVKFGKWNISLAEISAFLLAITPWHIHYSRGAWEVNVSLTLTLAGIYFFLKSFNKHKFLIYSAIFFALTLVTYQGAKLSTLIVLFTLLLVFLKEVKDLLKDKKTVVFSLVFGFLITIPIILSFTKGETGRLNVFSVFSYPRPRDYTQEFLDEGKEKFGSLSYYLFHSEALNFKRGILGRWFNHFSGRFLFFEGDWQNPKQSAPYTGMFVVGDLILFIAGFIALSRSNQKEKWFIILWALLAPLPAALSRDQIHAVRSYNLLAPLVMMSSFGLLYILESNFKKIIPKVLLGAFILFYIGSYSYYLDEYFVHQPKQNSQYWDYGYKQIVQTVTPIQNKYKEVKVQQSYAQPYIYFLFYQKYSPAKYQEQAKLTASSTGDVGHVEQLDNICFCAIDWSVNRGESNTLFVADTIRIPPEDSKDTKLFDLIKDIKYLNGVTAFRVIAVK